jgi:GNAT superfamily N-acetyltransferase
MREMFYDFSENTKYLRFHAMTKSMPHNKLQVFCSVDYDSEMAIIGLYGPPGAEEVVGVARYMTDAKKESAEVAFTVGDVWQRKGLGTYLFERLLQIARGHGIRTFQAYVLAQNSGMLKVFDSSGLVVERATEAEVVHVTMRVPEEEPGKQKTAQTDGCGLACGPSAVRREQKG